MRFSEPLPPQIRNKLADVKNGSEAQADMFEALMGSLADFHGSNEFPLKFLLGVFDHVAQIAYEERKVVDVASRLAAHGVGEEGKHRLLEKKMADAGLSLYKRSLGTQNVGVLERWRTEKGKSGRVVEYLRGESTGLSSEPRHQGTLVVKRDTKKDIVIGPFVGEIREPWKDIKQRFVPFIRARST